MRASSPPPDLRTPPPEEPPRQPIVRTPRWLIITIIAVVVAIAGGAAIALSRGHKTPATTAAPKATHSVTAARQGRQSADFSVVSGITAITVRTADIGDDLYRVTT